MNLRPILIEIPGTAMSGGTPGVYPGWLVPDTNDTLAIDAREDAIIDAIPPIPAVYVITHLPTGLRVKCGEYTAAGNRESAAAIAKRFFEEVVKLGADPTSRDGRNIAAAVAALDEAAARNFWRRVAGWSEITSNPEPEKA